MSSAVMHCFLFFLAVGGFHAVVADKLNVTIYYETLCPDSKKFFVEQFNKTYFENEDIQKSINPVFLPFGHGNKTENNYTCQHGPLECLGNKLQACAIRLITDINEQVKYVSCIMNNNLTKNSTETTFPVTLCKNEAGDVYKNITECYNSPKSDDLDRVYNLTMAFWANSPAPVPYVSFNDKRDDKLSNNATSNFKTSLCGQQATSQLSYCHSSASTFSAALIPVTILYFLTKLI